VVNGEMSLRRLKLSIYEVVTPRKEEEFKAADKKPLSVTYYTFFKFCIYVQLGEEWCSWLKHCTARWEVPLLISGVVRGSSHVT
jgi:hypothetical protein